MTEKRFRYDWKTGGFKDTQSNSCATSNMRVLETQINDACYNYEKKIKKLEKENKELKKQMNRLYSYFMDWHSDEMGGNQFSEMWDMVKEDERWDWL